MGAEQILENPIFESEFVLPEVLDDRCNQKARLPELASDPLSGSLRVIQMSTLEMAIEELKRLPGSKIEEVAALIHQLAQDVDEQKRPPIRSENVNRLLVSARLILRIFRK
ncbi:MAG: hypothetical protein JO170_22875 [Verrucomicrobia bacterium]|nr:hypothetical protein [Verrucomicrobiota bacterium]